MCSRCGSLHFAYGNVELEVGNHILAREHYDAAKKILEGPNPFHNLLSACYYKIACLHMAADETSEAL